MTDREFMALVMSAERRWLDNWVAGPTKDGEPVRRGQAAPDLELTNEDGERVQLSDSWADRPALVMLWRHLGCGCGLERLKRLRGEIDEYRQAGLNPVVVAPGEIERVIAYRDQHQLPAPVLADPDYATHNAFGLSHWSEEQVLYGVPAEYCSLTEDGGRAYREYRKSQGLSPVDDPWMQSGEFVVDTMGVVRVAYLYNYCSDYPDPRVFISAARMAGA